MKIPAFDLAPVASELRDDLLERWSGLLERTAFVGGADVEAFEAAFAEYLGAGGCVGVANGTDALHVALRALDLRPGDEVILPAFTFFATAEAVVLAGGVPVLADVEAATCNLDPEDAARRITGRTRGIVTVHLYGQPSDLDALSEICGSRGLWLVEDAAQAHGARWHGHRVGTFGSLSGWSFYPSKNLGCFGDGGAITGMDPELLGRARRIANHGRTAQYEHGVVGTNSRLDGLQAAVLSLRLPRLDDDNERRREIAAAYRAGLEGIGDLAFPEVPAAAEPVYHQVTIRTGSRDALREHLLREEIGSGVYYPLPVHRQPGMAGLVPAGLALPEAERAARECLSLPVFPQLADDAVDRVCQAIRNFFG